MFWNCGKHPGQELNPHAYPTRREFLNRVGTGFGSLALATLLADQAKAQSAGGSGLLAPKQPHFPGTAKRVCHIYQSGAQTHIDTWDPKPELNKNEGKTAGSYTLDHGAGSYVFDPQGRVRLYVKQDMPATDLAQDLKLLLQGR